MAMLADIQERLRLHQVACPHCKGPSPCVDGMSLARQLQEASSPQISVDARYVAGKIVTHMWIIFVLLPVVLAILFSLLK